MIADWGDESEFSPSNYAALTMGRDNHGNQLIDALIYIPVDEFLIVDASAGKYSANEAEPSFATKNYRYGIGSTQLTGFNFHIGARSWGKKQTIETDDLAFDLSYNSQNRWHTGILYERGDVMLFIEPAFSSRLTSINSDRSAWGINTSYSHDTGSWWLSYIKRDYERDLAALDNSLLLQIIVQNIALDQAYELSSDEYDLGYEWYFLRYDFSVQYSRVVSIIDDSNSSYLSLAHRYYINETFSLQTSVQNSLEENLINLNIGVGVLW